MFDIADDLADEHAASLAALPQPLPYACIRGLIAASAHDHRYAEAHRKAASVRNNFRQTGRAARLSRSAAIAEDRSADLLAEVR